MKILIALESYLGGGKGGGTESWADTMADYFRGAGHDVQMGRAGEAAHKGTELALICHKPALSYYSSLDCKKVYTSHGVIPDIEKPVPGADYYVGVSEEVVEMLGKAGYPATVIRNPIDTARFAPGRPLRDELGHVIYSSRYADKGETRVMQRACEELGASCADIGKRITVPPEKMPETLDTADLVIGLGRTALEAMSCGRPVVVAGHHGVDGYATPESLVEFRECNCSGRSGGKPTTVGNVAAALEQYEPGDGARLRDYVLENHAVEKIAAQYLAL